MLLRFIDCVSAERVDSAKSLKVDRTHLVLPRGKLVQQKSSLAYELFFLGLVRLPAEAEHRGLVVRDGHRPVGRRLEASGTDRHEAVRKHVHSRRPDEGHQGLRVVRHSA